MAAAIGVRGDYNAARLRELAKRSDDANQTRRLLALAAIYDGGSRTEAARIGGGWVQTGRGWGVGFQAEGPPGGEDRRGWAADGAGLGAGLQRRGTAGVGEWQGAWQQAAAHPGAPAGAAADRRERPDPGGSRRGALAADRPGAMGLRGIPHFDQ